MVKKNRFAAILDFVGKQGNLGCMTPGIQITIIIGSNLNLNDELVI